MKILYVLLDGVGDRADKRLNYLTPLEASFTPNLDFFARNSKAGSVISVKEGIAPESDMAVFNMLGYSFDDYFGRGIVEALGADMKFENGNLALRGNFATVDDSLNIIDRRVGRNLSNKEGEELVEELKNKLKLEGVDWELKHTVGHRVVLVIKAKEKLSANISNTDPAYEKSKGVSIALEKIEELKVKECKALDKDDSSKRAEKIVNEFTKRAHEILRESSVNKKRKERGFLPANVILLRDASDRVPKLKSIKEKYNLNFACLADMPVELGIAKLTGMKTFKQKVGEDYSKIGKRALELLKEFDGVYVHIKGPDEFGHDGEPLKKKAIIEQIDRKFFGEIREVNLSNNTLIVSADHSTPCQLKVHSDDPVPLIVSNSLLIRDKVCRFNEREVKKGSLGLIHGKEVLGRALSLIS
ncbi:MAG: alkaline phosphatase family protein [Nitrososphaerales archaeon]